MNIPDKLIFGITSSEYRPCYVVTCQKYSIHEVVREEKQKALFHKWTYEQEPIAPGVAVGSHPGGQYSRMLAIVEMEDGNVLRADPAAIRFVDTGEMMDQLAWPEEAER